MVYAHNIPIKPEDYERKLAEWADPGTWANCLEEYTYVHGLYTNAFRYFIKGAVGLDEDYDEEETAESVISRIDAFVEEIAYLNFIQGLVKSESPMATPSSELVEISKAVNREYLRILRITHCICWGKPTYQNVKSLDGYEVISEQNEGKRGFSSCVVDTGFGNTMHVLRIFHPSMPQGFAPYSEVTQGIISRFLSRS